MEEQRLSSWRKRDFLAWGLLLFSIGLSSYFYPKLPEKVPIHFNIKGIADGFASKTTAVFLMPGMIIFLYLLITFLPEIDPFRKQVKRSYRVIRIIRDFLLGFFVALEWASYRAAWTGSIDPKFFGIGFGLLFIVIGNYLPVVERNWFIGIRVPWTLASDEVWKRTHRVGGRLFFFGGLILILSALLGGSWILFSLLLFLALMLYIGVLYPFLLYKGLQKKGRIE